MDLGRNSHWISVNKTLQVDGCGLGMGCRMRLWKEVCVSKLCEVLLEVCKVTEAIKQYTVLP